MLGLMLIRFGRHSAFSQVSKCYGLIFTINMFDGTRIQGSPQVRARDPHCQDGDYQVSFVSSR